MIRFVEGGRLQKTRDDALVGQGVGGGRGRGGVLGSWSVVKEGAPPQDELGQAVALTELHSLVHLPQVRDSVHRLDQQ